MCAGTAVNRQKAACWLWWSECSSHFDLHCRNDHNGTELRGRHQVFIVIHPLASREGTLFLSLTHSLSQTHTHARTHKFLWNKKQGIKLHFFWPTEGAEAFLYLVGSAWSDYHHSMFKNFSSVFFLYIQMYFLSYIREMSFPWLQWSATFKILYNRRHFCLLFLKYKRGWAKQPQ